MKFVSRGGEKLQFALREFEIDPSEMICADFGCSTGGFTDCLLQNGAKKVYSVDTGYGVLDWKLRNDERVIVLERTNAMHVILPEKVDFISIDSSWTKQKNILPNAFKNLKEEGVIIALIKPHYEAGKPVLGVEEVERVMENSKKKILELGYNILSLTESPILGGKGKNKEFLALIKAS
jgi:23S rRNA (cytidine1920-2'-O)/16S rRNA (cytidine1409-2'-O)-methyltransferase